MNHLQQKLEIHFIIATFTVFTNAGTVQSDHTLIIWN